jgi:hypothetical protein
VSVGQIVKKHVVLRRKAVHQNSLVVKKLAVVNVDLKNHALQKAVAQLLHVIKVANVDDVQMLKKPVETTAVVLKNLLVIKLAAVIKALHAAKEHHALQKKTVVQTVLKELTRACVVKDEKYVTAAVTTLA